MAEVNGVKVPFVPIVQNDSHSLVPAGKIKSNFDEVFHEELKSIKFSNHAMKRLESRNIQIDKIEMSKIQNAVEKAESKGSIDSLVMMGDKAFIVNIPNKTIITALDIKESKENVFTNIDSVVFA